MRRWALLLFPLLVLSCSKKEELPPPETAAAPKPAGPEMKPAVLVNFSGNETNVLESRFSMSDDLDIRYGPGKLYPKIPGAHALKGSRIEVLEEMDGWFRFGNAPGPSIGWINKFASTPADDSDSASREKDVTLLMYLGVLVHVEVAENEAAVSTNLWNREDLVVQKGISRTLAYYCANKKGSSSRYIEIHDSESGHRIARYSESMGFSSYQIKSKSR